MGEAPPIIAAIKQLPARRMIFHKLAGWIPVFPFERPPQQIGEPKFEPEAEWKPRMLYMMSHFHTKQQVTQSIR